MNNSFISNDTELRAQIQLLRAYIQLKNNLTYQINKLKIKNSYRQANPDYKDSRDMSSLSKTLFKKMIEFKNIKSQYDIKSIKKVSPEAINKLFQVIQQSKVHLDDVEDVFARNQQSIENLELVKDKFSILKEHYSQILQIYEKNQDMIKKYNREQTACTGLEEEINDYKAEIRVFQHQIEALQRQKARVNMNSRASIDRIKIFHLLSDNALKLKSKLLLRDELRSNLEKAEVELEILDQKVKSEEKTLKIMQADNDDSLKSIARNEVELLELKKYEKKIELKIELLYKEKDELGSIVFFDEPEKSASRNNESLNEGDTYSLHGMLEGINEIKKEKESLIEENKKLKETISKLFQNKNKPLIR